MDDLASIDSPLCPACLAPCIPAGTTTHPYWVCPSCPTAVLATG